VRVEMEVSNRVVDLVQDGVDVALRVRSTLEDSGSLVVKNLGTTQALLVGSPVQLAREGPVTTVDDLATLSTLAMSAADGRATWKLVGPNGREYEFVHRPAYTANDMLTLKIAALQGAGICVLPDYMCDEELADGRLAVVLAGWAPPPAVVHAVFPSRRGMAPAVRRFLDFLGEHVSGDRLVNCPPAQDSARPADQRS
jgi:DNA-binding transcriptional LysR family regulator